MKRYIIPVFIVCVFFTVYMMPDLIQYSVYSNTNSMDTYGHATYKDFEQEFNQRTWSVERGFGSLRSTEGSYICESFISFNKVRMILSYSDYLKYKKFLHQYIDANAPPSVRQDWGETDG